MYSYVALFRSIDVLLDYYNIPGGGEITLDNYDEWYQNITTNLTAGPAADIAKCDINDILNDVRQLTGHITQSRVYAILSPGINIINLLTNQQGYDEKAAL